MTVLVEGPMYTFPPNVTSAGLLPGRRSPRNETSPPPVNPAAAAAEGSKEHRTAPRSPDRGLMTMLPF